MKKYRKLLVALSFSAALVSCDDGRIYPETVVSSEGKTVVLEGVLDGLDSWTSSYRVSIAGFEGADDEYADVSKVIRSMSNYRVSRRTSHWYASASLTV